MHVLVVAPLEGFVSGQSVVSCAASEAFCVQHSVRQVNTNFEAQSAIVRSAKTLKAIFLVLRHCLLSDVVYYSFKRGPFSVFVDYILISAICLIGKCRIIGHLHGNELFQSASLGALDKVFLRNIAKCDRVICLNSFQRAELSRLAGGVDLVVVPNFSAAQLSAEGLEKKIANTGSDRALKVLYLSNLLVEKGILDYVSVARQFGDDWEFIIVGKTLSSGGNDDILVKELLQVLPANCKYLGPVYDDEKFDLLKSVDVLVFPSVYPTEAQPVVLIEAMAFGVVPISYDRPYLSDILLKDCGCGFAVAQHDISSICGILAELKVDIESLNRAMTACRSRASFFSRQAFYERILAAIDVARE